MLLFLKHFKFTKEEIESDDFPNDWWEFGKSLIDAWWKRGE